MDYFPKQSIYVSNLKNKNYRNYENFFAERSGFEPE